MGSSGKSVEIAADKIANIIVGIATNGLGLDFGSLLGTLKAGISNENESQAYHKTKVFKKELKLAVIHLNKTLSKKKGSFTFFSASTYEIKMEGKITVIEAENEKALDELEMEKVHMHVIVDRIKVMYMLVNGKMMRNMDMVNT